MSTIYIEEPLQLFFVDRLATSKEEEKKENHQGTEVNWGIVLGDYSTVNLTAKGPSYEQFLKSYIQSLLVQEPNQTQLVLDLGGGLGKSFQRLARAFIAEIEDSKLAFIVTNLGLNPKELCDLHFLSPLRRAEALADANLVHFHQGPFFDIRNHVVQLPNGQQIPLEGNVSLVSERLSLTSWSKVPECDILSIPALLNSVGAYFVDTTEQATIFGENHDDPFYMLRKAERRNGIQSAHRTLVNRERLTKVVQVEAGKKIGEQLNWTVFRRKNAPQVLVD